MIKVSLSKIILKKEVQSIISGIMRNSEEILRIFDNSNKLIMEINKKSTEPNSHHTECSDMIFEDKYTIKVDGSLIGFVYGKEKAVVIADLLAHLAELEFENARLYESLKQAFISTVNTLAETIEKRDSYTGGHAKRVMLYSLAVGDAMKLAPSQMDKLRLGSILHDVGKIGIRDDILLKKDRLTEDEFETIKKHTVYGEEILKYENYFENIIPAIKHHHERFDGSGYPEQKKGEEIDITARIIAVADTFDAMTTDRPYRKGLDFDTAIEELKKNAGTQFDPGIVKTFVEVYQSGDLIEYQK